MSGFFHAHKFSATTPKFISKREMQESWRAIIKANHETIKSNHEIPPKAITTTFFRVVGWGEWGGGNDGCSDDKAQDCGEKSSTVLGCYPLGLALRQRAIA